MTEQVHIAYGSVRRRGSHVDHDRPLEHKLVAEARYTKTVKQPRICIAGKEVFEILPGFAREIQQALPDRRADVPWLPTLHRIASIYGCITRATRQMRA